MLSCGAIETARLLLNSATAQEPPGIGNGSDQVGRHLQGHYYPGAIGLFPKTMWDGLGPGASTATCEFNHGNDGIIGGGMLADEFIVLPIIFWKRSLPPDLPRWGAANKQFMRENYRRVSDLKGPGAGNPQPRRARDYRPGRCATATASRWRIFRARPTRRRYARRASCRRGPENGCKPPARHRSGAMNRRAAAFRRAASGRDLPHGR